MCEELTEYEPGAVVAYRLEGSAGPFASASSRWSTTPRSDSATIVTVQGFFTARDAGFAEVSHPTLRRVVMSIDF